jgi:hypothetical protein
VNSPESLEGACATPSPWEWEYWSDEYPHLRWKTTVLCTIGTKNTALSPSGVENDGFVHHFDLRGELSRPHSVPVF